MDPMNKTMAFDLTKIYLEGSLKRTEHIGTTVYSADAPTAKDVINFYQAIFDHLEKMDKSEKSE